jgi:hypothetical protein
MLDQSKNFVVSGSSLTVVHGNSITYEGQYADYPTSSRAGIQGKMSSISSYSVTDFFIASGLKVLYDNIAAGAMHNSKERYDSPKCHPDTRKAVLSDITSWISDHSKKTCILWLSAPAGSGKSAILQQIAENFYNSGGLSASFFFSRTATKRNRETFLIATLASQLATSIPATKPLIEGAIERDPSIFDRVLSEQIVRLVVYPLVYASLHPESGPPWPTLLVIDGLDECNGGERQAEMLRILRMALLKLKSSLPTLYLLIASRPEPAIVAVFNNELSDITHRLVLDDSYHPDRDIAVFLRSSFADIFRRRHARFPSMSSLPQPWPPYHIISFLVRKSSGQFIFAATVIRFIDVDRKIPTAQLQLILDICGSVDSSNFATNPFALLDELYGHVLKSSEETERAISILGAIFYLNTNQSPTLEILQALLQLEPEDITMIFWDLHSIVHIPVSDKKPIRFYHASLRDFLMDRHRSRNLYIDGSKAHSFLLNLCIQTLTDFHGGSTREKTAVALQYSMDYWVTHYNYGDKLDPGILDKVLEEYNPETWLPLDSSADAAAFISWWNDFALLRDRFHSRVSVLIYLV